MAADSERARLIEIIPTIDARINFAMQQNDVPVVKSLEIKNNLGRPLAESLIRIQSEPAFAAPWSARVASIADGASYRFDGADLALSPEYLGSLTERVRGLLHFRLSEGEEEIAVRTEAVDLLARDEWGGLSSLPEILAAFVTPNHPVVERVLREASGILGSWATDGDRSLSGYQEKNPSRVYAVTGAIYAALQRLDLSYINPPASFETGGQRIRLPDRIYDARMATCLDLAVLAAACLEQAGLNPLVVFLESHAFAGVWLEEECFTEATIVEPLRLRKRVDLQEIAVFDPTCVTVRPPMSFEEAAQQGKKHLVDTAKFQCAVDIQRCRKALIRPLPELTVGVGGAPVSTQEVGADAAPPPQLEIPAAQPALPPPGQEPAETPATRLDRWRRKLLDLSLRNRLLNFRETKKTIPILCPDLSKMEDALADGVVFKVLPRPMEFSECDPRDPEAFSRRTHDDALSTFLVKEMGTKCLHSSLSADELGRRLIETYRAARTGMEEGGASALYLAVGFLAWYETPKSTQRRLAPILLFPLEVHRESVQEGFTLRLGDDEPRLNVTLVEMLRQDFEVTLPGLDPLPEDEFGVDVPLVLQTFRKRIRDIDRWDVLDTVQIGIFSFAKFLMWRDLSARVADLLKNSIVDHLVSHPLEVFDPGGPFPDADTLDRDRSLLATFCPLPADASQLRAIYAAADGRSFVLEGPPGTGKSQTITNLIVHCLSEGKSVLFASEKMAALNVVHDRLRKVGLGQYCLELHSNKASKQEVLAQLDVALQAWGQVAPADWEREARRLEEMRGGLNAYAMAAHTPRSTGETLFEATAKLIGLKDTRQVELRWDSPDALNRDDLDALREAVQRLATAGAAVGDVVNSPWKGTCQSDWTPIWERDVVSGIKSLEAASDALEASTVAAARILSLPDRDWSTDDLGRMRQLAALMREAPTVTTELMTTNEWTAIREEVRGWLDHGRRRDALRKVLHGQYSRRIVDLDLDSLKGRWDRASVSSWPFSWLRSHGVARVLKSVSVNKKTPPKAEIPEIIQEAIELRELEQLFAKLADRAKKLLGPVWAEGEPDWDRVKSACDWVEKIRLLALDVTAGQPEPAAVLMSRWAAIAKEAEEDATARLTLARPLEGFDAAHVGFLHERERIGGLLRVEEGVVWGEKTAPSALQTAKQRAQTWVSAIPGLRNWCAWAKAREAALALNLHALVTACEAGEIKVEELPRVFERSYYEWWHAAVVSSDPVLSGFFSPEHERRIQQFRDLDDKYLGLTRQIVSARLSSRIPSPEAVDLPGSDLGILRREVAKKRRHLPVRKLFQTIPTLLSRLKPCVLMSPLSIAQYLDAGYPPFDVVVFDEASQIPVWDAVGAIARGKQAVVVGDPKQLPPTNFFQRLDSEETEELEPESVEDLESILDDCVSSGLPCLTLDWHYRSRHESLIAFSNYYYYANRLLTFPSPVRDGMGVSLRPVLGGVYDRGKSATNRHEAEVIVEEILRRLTNPELRIWSIGVVAFSQAQQTLIEDLLEKARAGRPDVDAFFAEDREEHVFVKNLENVQGDERDVILFSVCYGPDLAGKVAMNFGPLNRDGGERRLNVAITRARREVIVFSTLKPEQIDVARTRARGVADLKRFLEYASRGVAAFAGLDGPGAGGECESPFEQAVYDALVRKGWEVHKQVGCARYRIDLAVVDPAACGRYLLGVECDGANYHRAKTARDRDKLREGVLRDLGWQLHRVWSTDWWSDEAREIAKLEQALERARLTSKSATPTQVSNNQPTSIPEEADPAKIASVVLPAPPAAASTVPRPTGPAELPKPESTTYSPYPTGRILGAQIGFYEPSANQLIRQIAEEVVKAEGPISLELATRRVASHWGLERIHEKATKRVLALIRGTDIIIDSSEAGTFLWPSGLTPPEYKEFRVPGTSPESLRNAEDIPLQELANAAFSILRENVSAPEEELIRGTSRLFGFQRSGRVVTYRVRAGIELLIQMGLAARSGSTVTVRSEK